MKIKIINGSQKTGESNSGIILDILNELIKDQHQVGYFKLGSNGFTNEMFKEIISADVIVLAFPLFLDSIPSHTLKMLIELENIIKHERKENLIIYSIVNCGFYEGKQTGIAFEIVKHWCEHSGVQFGGGIGQGGGEMLAITKTVPINRGPFNNLSRVLQSMKEDMLLKKPFEIMYLNPYFPRVLYMFMAHCGWHSMVHKNELKKKDIKKIL
jgi:multimeric flavodoxin WrbA